MAEINGYPLEYHIGKTVAEIVPHIWPVLEPLYRRVLETGEPMTNIELSGVVASSPGATREWIAGIYPVRSDEGRLLGLGAMVVEITEKKLAEEALRQSQASLEAAQERARLGSWELDLNRQIGTWSQQMYHLFERDPALSPPTFSEFLEMIHPDDRKSVLPIHDAAFLSSQLIVVDFRSNLARGPLPCFQGNLQCVEQEQRRHSAWCLRDRFRLPAKTFTPKLLAEKVRQVLDQKCQ